MNLLYVEDDKLSRKVMRLLVANTPTLSHLVMFEDSENFEQRVAQLDPMPDMILLDIHVTPIDGFEMLLLLKANPRYKDISIVALTASVMNEEVHRLKTIGFDGIVAKPLNPDKFPDTLDRIYHGDHIWTIMS